MEPFHWQAAGMGYVLHTKENRFVVIDGGHGEDAEPLIALMEREAARVRGQMKQEKAGVSAQGNCENLQHEKPQVALWILTHPHDDHADALIHIADTPELQERIHIDAVAYNLPADFPQNKGADCEATLQAIHQITGKIGCRHICPKTGDRLTVDGLNFDFFFCYEDLYCEDPNEMSLVFRVSGEDDEIKTVLFTGDAYPRTADVLTEKYTPERLHADICQAAHHGLNGASRALYQAVGADTVLVPIAKPAFEAMLYGEYKDDPQADANRELMLGAMRQEGKLFRSADGDCCIELDMKD